MSSTPQTDDLRDRAVASLKRKQAFKESAAAYVLVNAVLVVIWAVSDHGFFWPIWIMAFWGLGLAMQGWNAYGGPGTIDDAAIDSEMRRLGDG